MLIYVIRYCLIFVVRYYTDYCWFNGQGGFSPVYVASQEGHTSTVDLLIEAGAKIHVASTKVD